MGWEVEVQAFRRRVRTGAWSLDDVEVNGADFNYGNPRRAAHPVNGVTWGASR